jgi:uncharacterized protein (DUF924 family)
MIESNAGGVLDFWFGREARGNWFAKDAAFDALVRARFSTLYDASAAGRLAAWQGDADGALALVILLDQFPRNMFRGRPAAFATDAMALAVSEAAIARDFDLAQPGERRGFFYLPFTHAEDLATQQRGVELYARRLPEGDGGKWAEAHRTIIARFGRFPHRNAILGRQSTPEETAFLKEPGSSF